MKKIYISLLFIIISSTAMYGATATSGGTTAVSTIAQAADYMAPFIEGISDNFGPAMNNAAQLANLGGYGIGDAYLGKFPHFYVGASVTAGMSNLKFFDPTYSRPPEMLPGGSPNMLLFGGIGFGKGLDLQFKAFLFSSGFLPAGTLSALPIPVFQLDRFNIYSAGAKLRYNLVPRKKIFPGLLELAGITVSAGADFLYNEMTLSGMYAFAFSADLGAGSQNYTYVPNFTLAADWLIISASVQAVVYIDFLWIFNLYAGIGASLNFGDFDLNLSAPGGTIYDSTNTPLATVDVTSVNKYNTTLFVPYFILGFEIDLWAVGIGFESMVNINNLQDVNLQVTLRYKY